MRHTSLYVCVAAFSLLLGCTGNQAQPSLDGGFRSLSMKQYDEAAASAGNYLAQSPQGPDAAKAAYLRGRAFEERPARSQAESLSNLNTARQSYIQALSLSPAKPLEGYIRTNLGKVEFYQEDYRNAVVELSTAYGLLQDADLKGWVLYYIGVSQQRLGRFADADQYLGRVQREYASSPAAQAAQKHIGVRQFYVQLAVFASAANADRAAGELRKQGITPVRISDANGRQLIRVGPYVSYDQARAAKSRLVVLYPDAIVVP